MPKIIISPHIPLEPSMSFLKTKKSYGQHLLNDEIIARQIVHAMISRYPKDNLLEIGPGTGVLTKYLLEEAPNFKAVEADRDMVDYLENHLEIGLDQIISNDVLKLNLEEVFNGESFNVIGNFPYNISTQIVLQIIKFRHLVPSVVGMFQKEVGDRICAAPGSKTYGKTSAWIQAYYDCKVLFDVPPYKFDPPPKVDSVVIQLDRKENFKLDCDERLYAILVKQAFSQRRKMLRNTLKAYLKNTPHMQDEFFMRRPERLSVEDFVKVTNLISEIVKSKNQND